MMIDGLVVGRSYLVKTQNDDMVGITVLATTKTKDYVLVRYADCDTNWLSQDDVRLWDVYDEIEIADWLCGGDKK